MKGNRFVMTWDRRALGFVAVTAAWFSLPSALILIALIIAGAISVKAALIAFGAGCLITAAIAQARVHDLYAVREYAAALSRGEDPRPPAVRGPMATDIAKTIIRVHSRDRRRLDALESELADCHAMLDRLPILVLVTDGERRVLSANRAARALVGDRIIGRDVIGSLRHPALIEAIDRAGRDGKSDDVVFTTQAPDRREIQAHIEPLRPARARDVRVVIAMQDLTAFKKVEQMRADFVANASHEIRTPLATLIGFIETLRGPARDDEEARDHFLAIMDDQARRMSRLVDGLLSLSRIEMNEHTPPDDAVSITPLIESVAAALNVKAAERNMRIELGLATALPAVVGDADELAQVFQNLIDNAIKYGGEDSVITVTAERTGKAPRPVGISRSFDAVAVAVRDRGEGIPREDIPRLTERFYCVDPARSRQVGSTGLGLAIVKHIVNRHRGHLTIESRLGEGSLFTVYLPIAPDAAKG